MHLIQHEHLQHARIVDIEEEPDIKIGVQPQWFYKGIIISNTRSIRYPDISTFIFLVPMLLVSGIILNFRRVMKCILVSKIWEAPDQYAGHRCQQRRYSGNIKYLQ